MISILEVCEICGKYKIEKCVYPCETIENRFESEGLVLKKHYVKSYDDSRKIADSEILDTTIPVLELDEKTRIKIRAYVSVCDRKSRVSVKYYFHAFLRCENENVIAERLNQSKNNISKKFIRICKCIGKILNKNIEDKIDLKYIDTPLKFKNRFNFSSHGNE